MARLGGVGGFTIVELVVVILLLGVLSATAMSRFVEPSAFAPGSIRMAVIAQGHYAAQVAQNGSNPIALRITRNGSDWQIDVLDGAANLRSTALDAANTGIEIANDGNVFDVLPADPLLLTFTGDGELTAGAVGAAALVADAGTEMRITGDSTHLVCFYPTGYASAAAC